MNASSGGALRFGYPVAAALAACVLLAGAAVMTVGVCGVFHDDGVYVSTAKALAEGRGYRLINLPAAPLQTRYPIAYPATLALIWRAWPTFPNNLVAMQVLSVVLAAITVALAYLYAIRVQRFPPLVAAVGLSLCATAPPFIYFGTQTLSEIPFALGLIAALWIVAQEYGYLESSRVHQIVVGLAVAVPCLIRLIGFAIVLPLLWTLWQRNRRFVWYATGAFMPLTAWGAWVWFARSADSAVRMAMNNPDSWDWLEKILSRGPMKTVGYNAFMLSVATVDVLPAAFKNHLAVAFPLLGIITWIAVLIRGRSGLTAALVVYAAITLAWPWPPARFLVPVWPLLTPFLVHLFYRRLGVVVTIVVAVLAVAGNIIGLSQMSERNRATHYPLLVPDPRPEWSAYQRTFAWVRMHTDPEDVVVTGIDPMFFLYTGRSAMRPFDVDPLSLFYGVGSSPVGTSAQLVAVLTRSDRQYLVQTPLPGFAEEKPFNDLLAGLRREHTRCLSPVYEDEQDSRFVVFAIDADACR